MQDTPATTNALIRDSVNIIDIIDSHGRKIEQARQGKSKTTCPHCNSQNCLVTPIYYRCNKCGKKGDVIDFYGAVNNISDWIEAKENLIKTFAPNAEQGAPQYSQMRESRKQRIIAEDSALRLKAISAIQQAQKTAIGNDSRLLKAISDDSDTYTTTELLAFTELYGGEQGVEAVQKVDSSSKLAEIIAKINVHKLSDLTEDQKKPPDYVVMNLIPVGLTVLCAPSKAGKSYFALQLFDAVSTGSEFLGRSVKQGDVYYFDLEGSDSLTIQRCRELNIPEQHPGCSGISHTFAGITLSTDPSAIDVLREYKRTFPSIQLFIVDTITHWLTDKRNKNNAYLDETALLAPLQQFALEENVAILAITHTNKSRQVGSSDPLDKINGSTAFSASAQSILALDIPKRQTGAIATLHCIHRQFPSEDIAMRRSNHGWELDTAAKNSNAKIIEWCIANAGTSAEGNFFSYSDVCQQALGIPHDPKSAARKAKEALNQATRTELFNRDVFVAFGRTSNGYRGIRIYKTNTTQTEGDNE